MGWAQTYNKKLMITEIGSWDAEDGTGPSCKAALSSYLQRMNSSGVFIGYQVWQFGCPQCEADLWAWRPWNFDWYRLLEFGASYELVNTTTPTTASSTLMRRTSTTLSTSAVQAQLTSQCGQQALSTLCLHIF